MLSKYLNPNIAKMSAYVPGEQPQDRKYIKLNTNECPYPPSPKVFEALRSFDSSSLRLYPDPQSKKLKDALAKRYGITNEEIFVGGGSDEILAYIFMAFCANKVHFPNVTYGFYKVCADLFGLEASTIATREDLSIKAEDYFDLNGNIFIANPNSPTGIYLKKSDIEEILKRNPKHLVIVDEAYIDFADEKSCIELTRTYKNLLVVQTFSKSRSLAGIRLGFAVGQRELIEGLKKVKSSINPYNIDQISVDVGMASLEDEKYFNDTVSEVVRVREWSRRALESRGFVVLPSQTNFLFAKSDEVSGEKLYLYLKEKGILIRYFSQKEISDYIRITVGTKKEMQIVMRALDEILAEVM